MITESVGGMSVLGSDNQVQSISLSGREVH